VTANLELTILMPCLNEAETLGICIAKAKGFLERSGVIGEVLIADNGSTDGSITIAEVAGARVVHVPVRGYGAALRMGIDQAKGRFVIMGDSDDSYDFTRLEAFVEKLREGYDLVMGNRFRGGIAPGAMPPMHLYFGNPGLSFIGRLFFKMPIGDFYCGLRGFDRNKIRALGISSSGMEFALEMIVRAGIANLNITEVPATLSPDGRSRPPHLRTWRDGWRSLRFFLMFSPRWLFFYPGLGLLAAGALLSAILLPGPVTITPTVSIDLHSLFIGSISIMIGVQCIAFAVIARRYAASRGFLPPTQRVKRFLVPITLERVLLAALGLGLVGLAGLIWCVVLWISADFGPLQYGAVMRALIASGTLISIAFQLAFTAFLGALIEVDA
jgi:hypothetical protein